MSPASACFSSAWRETRRQAFSYSFYRRFPALVQRDDGYWHWPDATNTLPLLFSVRTAR